MGASQRIWPGVSESLSGVPVVFTRPYVGWSISTNISRARTCGSSTISATVFTRAALPAPRRGREPRIARELAASDDLAEPAPYRVARPGRDGHVAVGRRVDARARAAERHIAGPRGHFAADGIALAEVVERDQQGGE